MSDDELSFRRLVDELPDLVCRFRPDGMLLYVNRAYAEYFGHTVDELIGRNFLELTPSDLRDEAEHLLASATELTPEKPVRTTDHSGGDAEGKRRWQQWVDQARFDADGNLVELLSVGRDITERRAAEELISYHSRHDSLTGLLNRRCTLEALDDAVAADASLGLLYVDLDGFKQVNDRDGHRFGDRLLADVAAVLVATVRRVDLVGRIGGDEFVVICPQADELAELTQIGDRINQRLVVLHASVSFGAVLRRAGESADDLLNRADEAMYVAKQR